MEEQKLETLVAQHNKRLTDSLQSFCVDRVLCFNVMDLPPEIKTQKKKAWVTVSGNDLPKISSVNIRYYGNWVTTKYGKQFKAVSYEILAPKSSAGLKNYLHSSLFKEIITKRQADKIISKFGERTLDVIKNNSKELNSLIGEEKAERLSRLVKSSSEYSSLFEILGKYGLSQNMIIKIHEKFGGVAKDIVLYDPYKLQECHLSFNLCDKIALDQGVGKDSYERILGASKYQLVQMENITGNTYFDFQEFNDTLLKFLNKEQKCVTPERIKEVFASICKNKDGIMATKFSNGHLYVMRDKMSCAEKDTATILSNIGNRKVNMFEKNKIDKELSHYCQNSKIRLSVKQMDAVKNSLYNRVSIITGGPGTGKTTIISAIIDIYSKVFKLPVTLMAPTGKAARRMSEATKQDASTIHSRLGIYDVEAENNHTDSKIGKGLIIVDEVSMVDMQLMWKLCSALASNELHVVFVGDVDQLPSVGPGSVLSSMIESGAIATTKLTEIFRQDAGSLIAKNAIAINLGLQDKVKFNDTDFYFVEADNEEMAKDIIVNAYEKEVEKRGIDNVVLLCPLRKTQDRFLCTSEGLNNLLQDVINPKNNYVTSYRMPSGVEFRENDRVLQWKNGKTSLNGDVGIIQHIYEDEDGTVYFNIKWDNGNEVDVSKEEMSSITLAYAMSIHKSQGSEYDTVIIPMLKDQSKCPLFKRNLLYTGVTRAKQKVVIVGDKYTFNKCIKENDAIKRRSFLANRLVASA